MFVMGGMELASTTNLHVGPEEEQHVLDIVIFAHVNAPCALYPGSSCSCLDFDACYL